MGVGHVLCPTYGLPRAADYAKSFLKDGERLSRSGRYNINQLKGAMLLLIANEGPLGLTGYGLAP